MKLQLSYMKEFSAASIHPQGSGGSGGPAVQVLDWEGHIGDCFKGTQECKRTFLESERYIIDVDEDKR